MIAAINSKQELFGIIEQVRNHRLNLMLSTGELVTELYRGQGQNTWKLEPNIVRKIKDENELKRIEKSLVIEFNDLLVNNNLSKHIQGQFLNGKFHSDWLLLLQAQHYGIPTRFMDWTANWEVALFFAVSNPADDIYDADFWIYIVPPGLLEVDNSKSTYYNFDPYEFDKSIFLNASGYLSDDYLSKIAMRRIARQNGRFLIQPYPLLNTALENNAEHSPNLHRITIPKDIKKQLREELSADGYTNENLYIVDEPFIENIKRELRGKYGV